MEFAADTPVPGRYRASRSVRELEIRPASIGGVPVAVGDRVRLSAQPRRAENGDYVVTAKTLVGPGKLQTRATLESPPVVRAPAGARRRARASGSLRKCPAAGDILEQPAGAGPIPDVARLRLRAGDRVHVAGLELGGVVERDGRAIQLDCEGPERRALERQTDKFHPLAVCTSDATIAVRELCESDADALGAPKARGVWDRPCARDADCPFFRTDRAYDNESVRGGCMDSGYCEMPLGVTQVSYRTFSGRPFCRGCPVGRAPADCCDDAVVAPDYAFAMDVADRGPLPGP